MARVICASLGVALTVTALTAAAKITTSVRKATTNSSAAVTDNGFFCIGILYIHCS
jgi:hypothetical protein